MGPAIGSAMAGVCDVGLSPRASSRDRNLLGAACISFRFPGTSVSRKCAPVLLLNEER